MIISDARYKFVRMRPRRDTHPTMTRIRSDEFVTKPVRINRILRGRGLRQSEELRNDTVRFTRRRDCLHAITARRMHRECVPSPYYLRHLSLPVI